MLPAEDAAVLDAALDIVRAELQRSRAEEAGATVGADASAEASCPHLAPDRGAHETTIASAEATVSEAPPAPAPTLTDAFLAMAQSALDRQAASAGAARSVRSRLTAHIDPMTGWGRLRDGELLPPSSLSAVMRTLPGRGGIVRLRRLTRADLRRHDLGRSQRLPSAALRDLLGAIDGECCRFPGCTRRRKLHAHHVEHWSNGGATDLDNLALVRLSHESRAYPALWRDRGTLPHGGECARWGSRSAVVDATVDAGLAA